MTASVISAALSADETLLTVEWDDSTTGKFSSIWLRDNLQEDRDPYSGQRLIDVTQIPLRPRIGAATVADQALRIAWQDEARVSTFRLDWLYTQARLRTDPPQFQVRRWLEGAELEPRRDFAFQPMAALLGEAALRVQWLTRLLQDGIAFLSDVPRTDEGILEAMKLIGRVAETNYGLVFDVRAVAQPENLAYSDVGLGLHTDNPYREPVPGFQALHTLVAAPDGGASLFADGFALAEYLRHADPEAFSILARTAVPFHFQSQQADLYAERPLIKLDCRGRVSAVHYNSRSIGPLRLPAEECASFYVAYRRFGELLRQERFQLRTLLGNGDAVVFDNQRILHGRTGFASAKYPRHMRGCYLTRDSVYSEASLLRRRINSGAAL